MTLHESKHSGYGDLPGSRNGRLHQQPYGEPASGQFPPPPDQQPQQGQPQQSPEQFQDQFPEQFPGIGVQQADGSVQWPPAPPLPPPPAAMTAPPTMPPYDLPEAPPAPTPPPAAPPVPPPSYDAPSPYDRPPHDQRRQDAQRYEPQDVPEPPRPSRAPEPPPRRPQPALFEYADLGPLRTGAQPAGDEDCFDQLARIAEAEDWSAPGHPDPVWVLREYIVWTFERLMRLDRISVSADKGQSAFNTGLATPQQETIYGRFVPNPHPNGQPWQFAGWWPESDRLLADHFPRLPAAATYADFAAELVYDGHRTLSVSPKRLMENPDNLVALPGALRTNPYQAGLLLEGAVRRAEARVRRNFRTAVPCWDPTAGRVRLLLPLSLTDPAQADVALVITGEGDDYRGTGILGLDVARVRARLLGRSDEWLSAR